MEYVLAGLIIVAFIVLLVYELYYTWNAARCFNCFTLMEITDVEETLTEITYHYKCPKCGRTRKITITKV
jgi:hypothetical protein